MVSALAHATWNLFLKRAGRPEVFSWWLLAAGGLLLLPMGLFLLWYDPVTGPGWWFVLGTIAIHTVYFTLLARGYARGDLSLVYPIARGTGPALVPLLGVVLLDERMAPQAAAGVAAVVVGILVASWWERLRSLLDDPFQVVKSRAIGYALLTGLTIAGYSIWDTQGVKHVNPFLYMYLLTAGSAVVLAPYHFWLRGRAAMVAEWRANWPYILAASLLTFVAYGLVLTALTFTQVSYVVPAREVGIVFGVILGTLVLKERVGLGRMMGSALILVGLLLIATSP